MHGRRPRSAPPSRHSWAASGRSRTKSPDPRLGLAWPAGPCLVPVAATTGLVLPHHPSGLTCAPDDTAAPLSRTRHWLHPRGKQEPEGQPRRSPRHWQRPSQPRTEAGTLTAAAPVPTSSAGGGGPGLCTINGSRRRRLPGCRRAPAPPRSAPPVGGTRPAAAHAQCARKGRALGGRRACAAAARRGT